MSILRDLQQAAVEAGQHPLSVPLAYPIALNTDSALSCGSCRYFRKRWYVGEGKATPKCLHGGSRDMGFPRASGPGTDAKATWPACDGHRPIRNDGAK